MYKGRNGIVLKDASTKWGWDIKTDDDILLAIMGYPYFATVMSEFIVDAIKESARDKKSYRDIKDLAQHIASNYI